MHSSKCECLRGSDDHLFCVLATNRNPSIFSTTLHIFQACFWPSQLAKPCHNGIMHYDHTNKGGTCVCSAAVYNQIQLYSTGMGNVRNKRGDIIWQRLSSTRASAQRESPPIFYHTHLCKDMSLSLKSYFLLFSIPYSEPKHNLPSPAFQKTHRMAKRHQFRAQDVPLVKTKHTCIEERRKRG